MSKFNRIQQLISEVDKIIWLCDNAFDLANLGIAIVTGDTENILSYGINIMIPQISTIIFPEIK